MSSASKQRRSVAWHFRFPLKALLGALTVAAIVAAWFGYQTRNALTLVTISVVDGKTGRPITEYEYRYSVATSNGVLEHTGWDTWLHHKSADGSFQIHAPRSCEVGVSATAPGYLEGFGLGYTGQTIRREDKERRVVLKLHPGVTVRGTIVDRETKQPVANAEISPVIFMPPLFVGDHDRAVKSDANGRFEVIGVDESLGIEVGHADYLEMTFDVTPAMLAAGSTSVYETEVPLAVGETLTGTVVDDLGSPVSDVEVTDGSGKMVVTDDSGRFTLRSPSKWNAGGYYVTFDKDGYIDQTIQDAVSDQELRVELPRLFKIGGNVVAPDGSSVTAYRVIAGPGMLPESYQCEEADVMNAVGEFSLDLDESGEHWIAVRAEGFAVWEGMVDVSRDAKPITIHLESGRSISGKVAISPFPKSGLQVRLTPVREDPDSLFGNAAMSQEFGTLETSVQADGSFSFPNVRPDSFTLKLTGLEITPQVQSLTLTEKSLLLSPLKPRGTGRVVGVVHRPKHLGGDVWDFASGALGHDLLDEPISFIADENGRFEIKHVPIGKATASVSFHETADIMTGIVGECIVRENETVEIVIAEEPNGDTDDESVSIPADQAP